MDHLRLKSEALKEDINCKLFNLKFVVNVRKISVKRKKKILFQEQIKIVFEKLTLNRWFDEKKTAYFTLEISYIDDDNLELKLIESSFNYNIWSRIVAN